MFLTYKNPIYQYQKSTDQESKEPVHHSIIIVGAGPIGMAAAIDAAMQGLSVVILDDNNTVSVGSRAVCYSKRSLEILDRLGCADRMVEKGVTWKVGKTFFRDKLVRQFDLLPSTGYKQPAFINLQQYYLEEYLVERMNDFSSVDVRWLNKVVHVEQNEQAVLLKIETPDGEYSLKCDWLIVADGANSAVRTMVGLESKGQVFEDRFLIADILMKADFPPERRFSFDPSYHRGWSTLLHRQPDNVWRLDFQLGSDADPEEEKKPENVVPRVKAMMGSEIEFELEWASVYNFCCRQMDKFRYGKLLFAGDAAHQVSPFGARGANSGFQDVNNLIWKLRFVINGWAPDSLLDTYSEEMVEAARENLQVSRRTTDFMSPKTVTSRHFRDAVLELGHEFEFAQGLTNSGRLSDPAIHFDSPLSSDDEKGFSNDLIPGAVVPDAPIADESGNGWLLSYLDSYFHLLHFPKKNSENLGEIEQQFVELERSEIPIKASFVSSRLDDNISHRTIEDIKGLVSERLDAKEGTTYLIRPDQYVCARWRKFDSGKVRSALAKAISHS